ncbi:HlyD family secretion protein [Aurantimonas sp. VKM B-3413]|uniref:HlyD family secretion protein n=1 Tax=Aurantimonas sp. VKM B-3413 TaxID=2779401 RepID=UPI001E586738|nr:HlyD family secretion protein [Aurantimonas sp. VKM B-3413]MCB8838195.1 HlyD family secretion protein [Aurantimonas sp. VKM B-3413]
MNAQPDKKSFETGDKLEAKVSESPAESAKSAEAAPAEQPAKPLVAATPKKKRRPIRKLLIVAVPLALAAGGGYYWVTGGRYINTEDAYVQQDRVTVMPQVSGQIASVAVSENEFVKAGQRLFTIDDSVYRNAVEQAQANLESARLDVEKLKAAYKQAVADRQSDADALQTAQTTYDRQSALVKRGVASQSALDDARLALQQAKGKLSSADQEVLSAKAALAGNPDIATDEHPEVMQALAKLHAAELDLAHTTVTASEPGIVSQTDRLQVGQYVTPATSVMSVIETSDSWVEANYKETELTDMHAGQPVDVAFDTYPDRTFHGTVGSIGAGTGSEFALLPAQNATGNWVKVVQRIPVRIAIADDQGMPPLRAGMSASVTVDTGKARGVPEFLQPTVTALGLDKWLDQGSAMAATSGGAGMASADASAGNGGATASAAAASR